MKICIPAQTNDGAQAEICGHFGSAPFFAIFDSDSGDMKMVENQNQHHEHGQCRPRKAVEGLGVEAVIAAGLGQKALTGLNEAGIRVYQTEAVSIAEIIEDVNRHLQNEMTPASACQHGHSHDDGHTHS